MSSGKHYTGLALQYYFILLDRFSPTALIGYVVWLLDSIYCTLY